MNNYELEQKNLLLDFLNIHCFENWKILPSKRPRDMYVNGLEMMISPVCNTKCSYCYMKNYSDELYPCNYDEHTLIDNCDKLNIIRLNNINDNQLLKILDELPTNTTDNAIMFTDKNISNAVKTIAISKNWTPISYDFDENYNIFIVKCDGNDEIGLSINRRGDITEYDGLTDWGDGTINDELYHTYMEAGLYVIKTKYWIVPVFENDYIESLTKYATTTNVSYIEDFRNEQLLGYINKIYNIININKNITNMAYMFFISYIKARENESI